MHGSINPGIRSTPEAAGLRDVRVKTEPTAAKFAEQSPLAAIVSWSKLQFLA
jgi:hypothetical protein